MKPLTKARADDELSFSAEVSVKVAKQALENADLKPMILIVLLFLLLIPKSLSCNSYRSSNELGIEGYAYDMMVGCSASTFGINNAFADIRAENLQKFWSSVLRSLPDIIILK